MIRHNNYLHNRNTKTRKRGQIEVFGLAFIVILISIGFFIYVSMKSQQKQDNPQKEYTNDKLANDFVLSILDVNIANCKEFTVKDLIVDCARDRRIKCNGIDSCLAVNESIRVMLNKTFMEQRSKFRFYSENLYYNNVELLNFTNLNCTQYARQGQRGVAIISLYPTPTNVYLNMNICY